MYEPNPSFFANIQLLPNSDICFYSFTTQKDTVNLNNENFFPPSVAKHE